MNNKGFIAWFASNPVAANIIMFLFVIGGAISVSSMRTETFPTIDPKIINVTVLYPGATPYEIADSITSRVEESLEGIDGVKRISSTAAEGIGTVKVELEDFADADEVYSDVETEVNGLSDFPPSDAERPIIQKVKITSNVLTLAVHGDVDEAILKFWAENLEDEIKQLKGVSLTSVRGVRDYQISIEISENSLRKYNLSLSDIGDAVKMFSVDVPAGTIESSQGDILLRVQEKKYTGKEFGEIVLKTLPDGSILRIKDIGNVIDGFDDKNLISKYNGENAAFVDVLRSETDDTLTIAKIVKDQIENIKLPTGVNLSLQKDETLILEDRISLMLRNGILGFMMVFLILLLFLDLKLAFWTSVAIPVSFLGGLMIVDFLGYSMNMISLFALIVVLGIVVDDAIVVGESIFDEQDKAKGDAMATSSATLRGVYNVLAPVTIGVTTTMAAFGPLIFSTGTFGQIVSIIPIVVIPILFISLVEAFFILPSHLASPGTWSRGVMSDIRDKVTSGLNLAVNKFIIPLAKFAVTWRYATFALFVAVAIITGAMLKNGVVRFVFFPQIEREDIKINITMPEGTSFEVTKKTMLEVEREVENARNEIDGGKVNYDKSTFESVSLSIGEKATGGGMRGTSSSSSNNIGQIQLKLVPADFREVSAYDVEDLIRSKIEDIPNIDELEFQSSAIGEEPDIWFDLKHPNDEDLILAANELKEKMKSLIGAKEVSDSFSEGKTEYIFELTPEGLAAGLSPAQLGQSIRSAFFGFEAQRVQRGGHEILVYVRYPKAERESISALNEARVRLPNGSEVALNKVATIKKQTGFSTINTVDGRRIVSVTAEADTNVSTPEQIIAEIENNILPDLMAKYTGLTYALEGESKENRRDLSSLGSNMLIAMMIIYVLLGSQLRSYIEPVIIMAAIPFGFVGAVWGHYLLGYDLTFISMFGIVALSGVVVNDSVVLVDNNNKMQAKRKSLVDATITAIKRRFRPILLTTLTTSLGLLPMLLETSVQAKFLIPMVVSLATGIIFATFIILLLVPSLLMIVEDIKNLFRRKEGKPLQGSN